MSQMFTRPCPNCGAPLSANQRFCANCGATMEIGPGPGAPPNAAPGGGNVPPALPMIPGAMAQASQAPQFPGYQQVPSVPSAPSAPSVSSVPSVPGVPGVPGHPSFPQQGPPPPFSGSGQPVQPNSFAGRMAPSQPASPSQAQLSSMHGQQAQSLSPAGQQAQPSSFPGHQLHPSQQMHPVHPAQPSPMHNPSSLPQHQLPMAGRPALPVEHSAHVARAVAKHSARMGIRALLTKPVIAVMAVVVLAGAGAGVAYSMYRASAPTSFVIGTDYGSHQIVRIDLATRKLTVLLSSKVLPGSPDSAVFISDTKLLMDFPGNGEIGIGDIQSDTYTSVGKNLGSALRDMALKPDGSSMLIADSGSGTILQYNIGSGKTTTFAQNVGGVQGLAFDSDGALYAAAGGQVIQLDPTSGKQIKTFTLPGGSDGMAYNGHTHMLDIAIGGSIVNLDPKTGTVGTLIEGLGTADGLAVDRGGNLFIADNFGILELNTSNQLLIVGTNTNGIVWDDVAPLSGSGAASY